MRLTIDATDRRILDLLERDGRCDYADLARDVSMSVDAVTERVRRLERLGVISGYAATVDADKAGLSIMALVRLRYPDGNFNPVDDLIVSTPEIIEAHHATGEDCFILKVLATSMRHLEAVCDRIGELGQTPDVVSTSFVKHPPVRLPAEPGASPSR